VPVSESALDDPGKAVAPVVTVAGEEAHAITITGHDQAVAVVFDFVEPGGGRRNRLAAGWQAGGIGAAHGVLDMHMRPELRAMGIFRGAFDVLFGRERGLYINSHAVSGRPGRLSVVRPDLDTLSVTRAAE